MTQSDQSNRIPEGPLHPAIGGPSPADELVTRRPGARETLSEQSNSVVVGHVEPRPLPVTVQREPEVGIAWEATCAELGLSALGGTPGEATANLGNALRKRGLADLINVDQAAVDKLGKADRRS